MSKLLLLLIGLPGCGALPAPTSLELCVMSYNVRYGTANDGPDSWPARADRALGVLGSHSPDIVGMQELLDFQRAAFLAAHPSYAALGEGRMADGGDEQSAILYRTDRLSLVDGGTFWLSEESEVKGSRSWDSSLPRICTWARFAALDSSLQFYVFNTHFDHRGSQARLESAKLIERRLQSLDPPLPAILTGDLNAAEDSAPLRELSFLVDTFRALHPEASDVGTFHGFGGDKSGAKIDFVLASSEFEVLEAEIVHDQDEGRYPSDHFPVRAHLRLP